MIMQHFTDQVILDSHLNQHCIQITWRCTCIPHFHPLITADAFRLSSSSPNPNAIKQYPTLQTPGIHFMRLSQAPLPSRPPNSLNPTRFSQRPGFPEAENPVLYLGPCTCTTIPSRCVTLSCICICITREPCLVIALPYLTYIALPCRTLLCILCMQLHMLYSAKQGQAHYARCGLRHAATHVR